MSNLLEQMPKMLTGAELTEALWLRPAYKSDIRNGNVADRLLALEDIYKLYVPSELSVEVYNRLYISILRNLRQKDSIEAVRQRNQNFNIIQQKEHRGVVSGCDSFTIIGESGIGKTTAIEQAIKLATDNQILIMPDNDCKIIPCIQIQCPFDCSVKSMLLDILRKIDDVIGGNAYDRAIKSRSTVDVLIGSVASQLLNHVCVLVIDEIQNVVFHRSGKSLVGALTQLINYSGVAIVMVGIPESEVLFQQTEYLARRAIGLHFEKMEYGPEFISFCKMLYQYIYTKKAELFSEGIALWLYEHSGGCLAIVVALFHDAQEIAIASGGDELNFAALDNAYKKRYATVYKQKIRSKVAVSKKKTKAMYQVGEGEAVKPHSSYSEVVHKAVADGMDIVTALTCQWKVIEVSL